MNKPRSPRLPSERRVSMERAFNGTSHSTIKAVALHSGVKPAQARAFLLHLIKTGKLSKTNKFAARLRTRK